MAKSEKEFIELCKQIIEERFSVGNDFGQIQRDLEVLSTHIEEKTGISISLSTLKRLWKNNYKQRPQLATLNALALLLDYKDWQDFKQANSAKHTSFPKTVIWAIPCIILIIFFVAYINTSSKSEQTALESTRNTPSVHGPISFQASKTVTQGIPNTVVFSYDVTNVVADSFYIQLSWNPRDRISIDPEGSTVTGIYYESGFHRARLVANDSILAEQPFHIISNGWEPHIYYKEEEQPIDFKDEPIITNGQLHLDSSLLAKRNIDTRKKFHSRVSYSDIFNLHSDNFKLLTRLKVDDIRNALCPWMVIMIITEVNVFRVILQDKGCEKYAGYKLGEISKNGNDNDLSKLGREVKKWQELEIKVIDKQASIIVNDSLTYTEVFSENLGKIVGLVYAFDGTGTIDYARLEAIGGHVVFEDNFDEHRLDF